MNRLSFLSYIGYLTLTVRSSSNYREPNQKTIEHHFVPISLAASLCEFLHSLFILDSGMLITLLYQLFALHFSLTQPWSCICLYFGLPRRAKALLAMTNCAKSK